MTQIDALKTDEIQNYEIEHQEEVRRLAGECMVILENDGVLPLQAGTKKIALFGTCGMGNDLEYYKKIEENIRVFIEDDNEYLGAYICQGKMPISVREKYLSMKTPENTKMINAMLRNFDMAMLHPDTQDLEGAKAFVQKVFEDIRKEELQYE